MPAPEGWDLKKVQAFFRDFEDEAYKVFSKKEQGDHASLPAKQEREIIGQALSQQYVMPDEIKGIEFQVRRKGGKPSIINIEDDNTVSNIRAEDATQQGLTLDDIINVLDIVSTVNFIMNVATPTDDEACAADLNSDGIINVLDIVQLVNIILN